MSKKVDWIGRDDDFVHRGKVRSGWEDTHKTMSDYLLGDNIPISAEGQIKEMYQLCRNRADNMAGGINHKLYFSGKEATGHTDGKKVWVSTKVMDEKKTFQEKTDIMMGIVTHEMSHILHTDFDLMKKRIKNRFIHGLWNTIEDERIEHAVGEEFPGYIGNMQKVKEYIFDEKYLLEKALKKGKKRKLIGPAMPGAPAPAPAKGGKAYDDDEDVAEEEDDGTPKHLVAEDPADTLTEEINDKEKKALELLDLVFKFIRYPKYIDDDIAARHETALDDIKSILTPYPTTPEGAIKAAEKVGKIIRDELEDDMDPSEMSGVEDMISDMMDEMTSDNEDDRATSPKDESEAAKKFNMDEEYIEDPIWKAVFRKGQPDKPKYDEMLREVKGDAARLASVLFTKVYSEKKTLKGMRSGSMDDSKMVEAAHGVKTIYTHTTAKVSKKLNMVLLIDESGSMYGAGKYRDAAKVGILMERAFGIFPVGQLFIYGFTSEHEDDFNTIFRYKEPGLDVKYGLGSVTGRSENRDGHCIRAVARRVRTFTNEPMIFFIISDGMPSAPRYGGMGGMKDTRAAVTEVGKMNFFPIQIGIGGGISIEDQKIMFDDFVNYSSSRQMVDDIRKLLLRRASKLMGI